MSEEKQENSRSEIYEELRPWGTFRRFTYNQASTVKIITVNPGQTLSLQLHHHRDELWIVLNSGLQVTLGDRLWEPEPYEEIFIVREAQHRAAGVGRVPSRWLEIAFGNFDEQDVVRLDDQYGRDK